MDADRKIKDALRLISNQLNRQEQINEHLRKLFISFFPLDLYKQLRPDVVKAANDNGESIVQHYIEKGYTETNLPEALDNLRTNPNNKDIDINQPLPINPPEANKALKYNLSCENESINKRNLRQLKELAATLILHHKKNIHLTGNNSILPINPDPTKLGPYLNIAASINGPLFHLGGHDLIGKSLELYGEWAQIELNFLNNFISEGDVVIDGGSYIGSHARSFSKRVGPKGQVHCFEPNKYAYQMLGLNSSISKFNNLKTYFNGLGEKEQKALIFSDSKNNLGSTFLQLSNEKSKSTQSAQIFPLDKYTKRFKIDFIKLDVEGMELDALLGAHKLITKFHPIIYCEFNTLAKASEIFDWAKNNNYRSWACIHDAYNPKNYNLNEKDFFEGGKECGLLLRFNDGKLHTLPATEGTVTREIENLDDMGLTLAKKPQYAHQSW